MLLNCGCKMCFWLKKQQKTILIFLAHSQTKLNKFNVKLAKLFKRNILFSWKDLGLILWKLWTYCDSHHSNKKVKFKIKRQHELHWGFTCGEWKRNSDIWFKWCECVGICVCICLPHWEYLNFLSELRMRKINLVMLLWRVNGMCW